MNRREFNLAVAAIPLVLTVGTTAESPVEIVEFAAGVQGEILTVRCDEGKVEFPAGRFRLNCAINLDEGESITFIYDEGQWVEISRVIVC